MSIYLSIIALVFGFDVLTKVLVRSQMSYGQEIVVTPFFSLLFVENTGVAFGMFQGRNTLFMVLGVVVLLVFVFLGWKTLAIDRSLAYIIALIIGGGMGNVVDRIFFGKVTDFLDFHIGAHHWPAFNVADSAICVGAALLILQKFWKKA